MSRIRWAGLFVTVFVTGAARVPDAAVIQAASASSSDVQAAVDAAKSGDMVVVPAGSVTWSATVAIPDSKKLTLQGAGMDKTVITRSGESAFNLGLSGSRVTGFGFVNAGIYVDGDDWRIDHNKCTGGTIEDFTEFVQVRGEREKTHPRGLIDNNVFHNSRVIVIGWADLAAHALWAQPLALGSAQMVFIEDNVFTASEHMNAVDANYGGRYVFRHNTVTDNYLEVHSLQEGRAARSWEIYDNTFCQSKRGMWTPFFIRGGTGVVFNNTLTGTWGQPTITLDNVRSKSSDYEFGRSDGSSPADGNKSPSGWPARDQIGRSADESLWTAQKPYPPQASDPAYFWNNKHNGNLIEVYVHNNCGPWIQAGRDFHNNTERPGYKPYAYPHPLRREARK